MERHASVRMAVSLVAASVALMVSCGVPEPVPDDTPPPETVWVGDLETGDLSQFEDTPWNTVAAEPPTIGSTPTRFGNFAVRTTIPANASTDSFGARSEIVPRIPEFVPGDDRYFAFSTFLEEGFPVQEEWQVVTQWKSLVDGSPPLELDVQGGRFLLAGGSGHPEAQDVDFETDLGPAATNTWDDWVVHVTFSPDPAVGAVAVWRNGVPVLGRMQPPGGTMYPDPERGPVSYTKYGYYRRSGIGPAGTVVLDGMRIGPTYDAVVASGR